jgi:hypothetical protein
MAVVDLAAARGRCRLKKADAPGLVKPKKELTPEKKVESRGTEMVA